MCKGQLQRCSDFKETAEVIAKVHILVCTILKVAFKYFFNLVPTILESSQTEFLLQVGDMPLVQSIEIPSGASENFDVGAYLCGLIRGALDMVSQLSNRDVF